MTSEALKTQALIEALEDKTRDHADRVVRLRGEVSGEFFELLIFRGFSSSTTHPTAFDPDASVLPDGTCLASAELLEGPLNPSRETVLMMSPDPLDLLHAFG